MELAAAAAANHRARFRRRADRVECFGRDVLCLHGRTATLPFPRSRRDVAAACARVRELRPSEVGAWATRDDAALGELLLANGFQDGWQPHWMGLELARRLGPASRDVVERRRVVYAPDLPYAHAPTRGEYERVVVEDGVAIAHARLFPWRGVGGIYDVGVVPAARRRGLGRELTLALCELARELGCKRVVLNATADGEQLYRALGFESGGFGRTWWWFPRDGA